MKKTFLIIAITTAIATSLSSCAGQKAQRTNSESSTQTTMAAMNDTTKIQIDTENVDAVKLLFAANEGMEAVMHKSDYGGFAHLLSTAVYDTGLNDSGIMIKMVAPDYTAIISYENTPADENDWLMIWKSNGRAKFHQKWFFIADDKRVELYTLLEKYRTGNTGIDISVWPERNGGAPQTLELTIRNNTDEVINFGAGYSIERLVGDKWVGVDLGTFAVITIMYGIQPGNSDKYTINLFTDRVTYPEGDYRVVKYINIGEKNALPYYANFKIIEPR